MLNCIENIFISWGVPVATRSGDGRSEELRLLPQLMCVTMVRDRPRIQTRIAAVHHSTSPCHSAPAILQESPFSSAPQPSPFSNRSRPSGRSGVNKRRKSLLALLEELLELREEVEGEERQVLYPAIEDDRDYRNAEGIEKSRVFDESISLLVLKLQSFSNAIRQLPSSVGLLNATNLLRSRLPRVQRLFQDNASGLFDFIPRAAGVTINPLSGNLRRGSSNKGNSRERVLPSPQPVDISALPTELESLSEDLEVFLNHLYGVPEFIDESVHTTHGEVNASITAFIKDLRYRASCLREFEDRLFSKEPVISGHINDLTEDLVLHMVNVRDALNTFIEVGIPAIRYSKQRMAASLQNLSTVATFFSGVTATTLQFTFEHHGSRLSDLVNALWIGSLVFSISSAINAQLAYHCQNHRARGCVSFSKMPCPMAGAGMDCIYATGFSCSVISRLLDWTLRSEQSPAVRALVTSFTAATSSGLLFVGIWFALERWTFVATNGSRWLLQILVEYAINLRDSVTSGIAKPLSTVACYLVRQITSLNQLLSKTFTYGIHLSMKMGFRSRSTRDRIPDTEGQHTGPEAGVFYSESNSPVAMANMGPLSTPIHEYLVLRESNMVNTVAEARPLLQDSDIPGPAMSRVPSMQNARFRALVRRIIHMLRITPQPWPEHWSDFSLPIDLMPTSSRDLIQNRFIPQRIRTYVPMLRTLHSVQLLSEHLGLVKDLQFSPNGQFLATCSWDRTALIWKVGSGPSMTVELMHSLVRNDQVGGVVSQVAWSTSGEQLLTKQRRCIRLWTPKTRVCWRTILRQRDVQCIAWVPRSRSKFVSVEWNTGSLQAEKHPRRNIGGSHLVITQLVDRTEQIHNLDRLQVWDMKVMPDGERVACVATLLQSQTRYSPINSRYEKRILIYNFRTSEVESQVPLLHDARDIVLASLGNYALVSYKNKAPPQTWRINEIEEYGEDGSARKKCQLTISQTYRTKARSCGLEPVDFIGPSFFGGPKDTFILAASRAGEIYIWERSSGILLHTLISPSNQQLTSLAWNPKSPHRFMLASGARDGTIRMWITKSPQPSLALAPPAEIANSVRTLEH
ncbi:hypothetical protein OPQ81_000794 [Rhizoctonia solani]|nr:hypothetical protein OPQ81_000794 [Rhizoctonia solani]